MAVIAVIGVNPRMDTTITAVMSTMQTVEYNIKYNTITDHYPPEADRPLLW
jgi:hypothetical protein